MPNKSILVGAICGLLASAAVAADTTGAPKESVFDTRSLGIKLPIKMVGPCMEAADLQIICLFKHNSGGDAYQGSTKVIDLKGRRAIPGLNDSHLLDDYFSVSEEKIKGIESALTGVGGRIVRANQYAGFWGTGCDCFAF